MFLTILFMLSGRGLPVRGCRFVGTPVNTFIIEMFFKPEACFECFFALLLMKNTSQQIEQLLFSIIIL